jgi:hypothetical protein
MNVLFDNITFYKGDNSSSNNRGGAIYSNFGSDLTLKTALFYNANQIMEELFTILMVI